MAVYVVEGDAVLWVEAVGFGLAPRDMANG